MKTPAPSAPAELRDKASARLGAVALGLAAMHLLSLALDLLNHLLGVPAAAHQGAKNAISVALIVTSLLVWAAQRWRPWRSPWAFGAYHVAVALGMELSAQLTPWPTPSSVHYELMRTISWTALWIVVFPLFVPTRPGPAALTALVAATTGPLALLTTTLLGNASPGLAAALYVHGPTFLAAALAALTARLIYGLEREATAQRELGDYTLKERIGEGGMGQIWRAEHRLLARPAAVKLIPAELGGDEERRRRFEREARATATLNSPHTVELYDFGVGDDGTIYYVMELLEGLDLEELVRRHGPQPPARVVHLLRQVCDSLAEAHGRGLLHRDMKPSNIMVCPRGLSRDEVKVLDFGLVRAFGDAGKDETRLTKEESLRGTPSYTAPEIALDEEPIDGRADLYSLACVGYWLLTAHPPFERESPLKTLLAQVQEPPVPPSRHAPVPRELEDLLLVCLAKAPEDRPADAETLARRLASCHCSTPWSASDAAAFWED